MRSIKNDNDILKTIVDCAMLYHTQLENKNLLFLFNVDQPKRTKNISYIETLFEDSNFLHLTGTKSIKNSNGKNQFSTASLYNAALNGKLNLKDLVITPSAKQKLSILDDLMKIEKSCKNIGDFKYDPEKPKLVAEKVVGTVHFCMGFVLDKKTKYFYVPDTALKMNIDDITNTNTKILMILKKDKDDKKYKHITYISNYFDLKELNNLKLDNYNLIDFNSLEFVNKNDIKNVQKVQKYIESICEVKKWDGEEL